MSDNIKPERTIMIPNIEMIADNFVKTITNPTASMTQKVGTKELFIAGIDFGMSILKDISMNHNEQDIDHILDSVVDQMNKLKDKIIKGELTYEPKD